MMFIGIMSGTSLDAVDAVIVEFNNHNCRLVAHHNVALPKPLKSTLLELVHSGEDEINRMAKADILVAEHIAHTIHQLLAQSGITADNIKAIGSHGQTIRHLPQLSTTLQIGDPNRIAQLTGITTVADFRRRDMAAGGQGAPLVPAFHASLFQSEQHQRLVLNIGGIANITYLPADTTQPVIGFDTGPGNCLMNEWAELSFQQPYDRQGQIAQQGCIHPELLQRLLADDYFTLELPKSTGREHFHLAWLKHHLNQLASISPEDVMATLCELTAVTIADSCLRVAPSCNELYVCGGGVHNTYLLQQLKRHLPGVDVGSTAKLGVDPDYVEAMAFAWLAKQTLEHRPGNLPSVTGASEPVILGGIYFAR
ncbi:MAG: anhydro-N-acetylmuramic acid kinase [Gammaproteobacteria bacterium]|nr:anhydro-N-acetylmuramic acid kinase [Gammaproteobacteria bacterium]